MNIRMSMLLLCLLAATSQAQQSRRDLYVWKDANGVTHYSDVPAPGAKRMTILGSSGPSSSPPVTTSQGSDSAGSEGRPQQPASVPYFSLEFASPSAGATYFEADSVVEVQLVSRPGLQRGDRLITYLDGQELTGAENAYGRSLTGLERGEHTLTAVILDPQGVEKISADSRTFYVRVATVDNPRNVGPSLKPKPPPAPPPTPTPPKSPK
jgi:hypothetical protein